MKEINENKLLKIRFFAKLYILMFFKFDFLKN
jgi:hypothetical protein